MVQMVAQVVVVAVGTSLGLGDILLEGVAVPHCSGRWIDITVC